MFGNGRRTSAFSPTLLWPQPILIKVSGWWQIPPQHQTTYLGGPESASIEIPSFRPHFIKFSKTVFYVVKLVSQCSHLEVHLLCKFGPERQDFNWCRFVNTKKWKNEVRVKSLLWGNIFFTTEVEVWVKARISCIYWVQGVRFLLQLLLIMSTYCKSHTTRFLLSLCHLKQEEEEHRGALWFSRICISI